MKIFTSGAVWAILLANACGNYGAYMIMTQIPTYMKDVLKFDIKSVSVSTLFLIVLACGDSESFVRGVPTEFRHFCLFLCVFVDVGRDHPITTKSEPSSASQRNAI